MISLALLDKEDLRVLFEGFNTDFLSIPLKKPAKTLIKYVPTGFRIGKLPRNMLIRMYCDAVYGNEPSICEFVKNEIIHNFDDRGITEFWSTVDIGEPLSIGLALSELQSILLENGFTIPAYVVLLLYGVECSDKMKSASKKLYTTHLTVVEKACADAEKRGKIDAEAAATLAVETAEKSNKKASKRVTDLEGQVTSLQETITTLRSRCDELEEDLSKTRESEARALEANESSGKQIVSLSNDKQKLVDEIKACREQMRQYDARLEELDSLQNKIAELRSELSQANERAYSDSVLQRLCADILDELRASSLGDKEILTIAKRKFTEADSIIDAWVHISDFSEEHIKQVIDNITNSSESNATLDIIEEIEDGILIKFAVLKAIKSILYNELENGESKRTIADKFAEVDDKN